MRLGAHESVAGGLDQALSRAEAHGGECVQIFTKNASRWREPSLTAADAQAFTRARARWGRGPVVSHASYLINLCAEPRDALQRSREALHAELVRCDALGVEVLALHPGAAVERSHADAVAIASESLATVLERTSGSRTRLCLENTAGQGSSLGSTVEELAELAAQAGPAGARLGFVIDTQHLFAAGYDLRTAAEYGEFWRRFDALVGLDRVCAFHLNDSKTPFGTHVDRHEVAGEGAMGLEPFWRLLNDPVFADTPGIVELDQEEAERSLGRLRRLRGGDRPERPHVAAPLTLSPPEGARRTRSRPR